VNRAIFFLFALTVFLTPLIMAPFTVDYYLPPKELFSQLVIILCLSLWLIKGARDEKLDVIRTKFYALILLFLLISGLSLLRAGSLYLGVRDYSQSLLYIAAFFICANVADRQRGAITLARLVFLSGFLCAVYALFQYFGYDFIKYPDAVFPDWRFRLYSTFGSHEFLANYLLVTFPVGVAFYLSTENLFKKSALLVSLAVIYSASLAIFSFAALCALFFAGLFVIFVFQIERIRLKGILGYYKFIPHIVISVIVLILILGLVTYAAFLNKPLYSVFNRAKASIAWRSELSDKIVSYKTAYRMINDHPILGVGIGNFKMRFPEYRGKTIEARQQYFDSSILDRERRLNVQNDLVQVWVETGLFGFLISIAIILILFKMGLFLYFDLFDYRRKLFVLGLLAGMSSFIVHSFLSFPFHVTPNGLAFWTLAGLLFTQLPQQDRRPVILNIGPINKMVIEVGLIFITALAFIWPVRIYLSDVFLKRMIDFDKKGATQKAVAEAKTSVFLNPNSNASIYLGNYAALSKDYDSAVKAYQAALKNNDEISFHIALADAYYEIHLQRDSINEYLRALRLNPYSSVIRLRLAELYAANRFYSEAETECQFLLMHNQGDETIKNKVAAIMKRLLSEKLLSGYYGEFQINK
jgi:putative inorganic carbon (hco3(-)) transporter